MIKRQIFIVFLFFLESCSNDSKGSGSSSGSSAPKPVTETLKYYNHYPFNFVYTMNLTLGNQSIEAVVDTGSANLLVLGDSTLCTSCVNDYGFTSLYSKGANSLSLDTSWYMNFAPIGFANIQGYQDNLKAFGNTLSTYSFGVVTSEKGIPNIIGLGYKAVASPTDSPQTPVFDSLISKYKFNNQFSTTLCGTKKGSNLTIGGYDSVLSSVLSKVQWTSISQRKWYQVSLSKMYTSETTAFGFATSQWSWEPTSSDNVIVDSGTNPLVIPSAQIEPLVAVLKSFASSNSINIADSFWPTSSAKGSFATIADADIAKFPDLKFDFPTFSDENKNFTLTVKPSMYFQTRADNGQRYLAIQGGSGPYILGTAFMESYVVLHNRGAFNSASTDSSAKVGFYPSDSFCR